MAATRISNVRARLMCDALVDLLDNGISQAYVEIRTGTQPANGDDLATGTVLATVNITDPVFGVAADANPGGRATANAIATVTATGTGTATWFRAYDKDDNGVWDGSVSESGGGGDMIIDNEDINSGQDVTITSWTVTQPES